MNAPYGAQSLVETPYRLDSVVPAKAPDGGDGLWYRYVIAQGSNTITGLRSGSRAELDQLLQQMVERLNERALKQLAKKRR